MMTETTSMTQMNNYKNCPSHCNDHDKDKCPPSCPCPILLSIVSSIAHQEDSLACILAAECDKITKVVDSDSDFDDLLAIDTSVQTTIQRITELEGVLKAKLDAIVPLLDECV